MKRSNMFNAIFTKKDAICLWKSSESISLNFSMSILVIKFDIFFLLILQNGLLMANIETTAVSFEVGFKFEEGLKDFKELKFKST